MGLGLQLTPVDALFTEGINEVIVTTSHNAAPMGIIRKNDSLSMIVFRTSHTADHIIHDGWVVAHITHDPVLFVKTAFQDLPEEFFIRETAGGLAIYRLKDIKNWIACRASVLNSTPEKIFVHLDPFYSEIVPTLPKPIHRGLNNIIEATVHGTRFILNRDPALYDLMCHHGELVMRCGGEPEKKALQLLYGYINELIPHTFE
jgi:uncharacterized protein